jgi:multidrug efflux pump subunit AcrB
MNGIIKWWAQNTVAANLLMLAILIAGVIGYVRIDRELDPYVEFPGARVSVLWLGASPQDIEDQIVVRMEEAVSRIKGIDKMWSVSSESVGTLIVVGDQDLNSADFLQEVKREIDSITTFPPAAERPQLSLFSNNNELMRVAISGDVDERVLSRLAEEVRREIALLPGVPQVNLFGIRNEEVSIEVTEESLRRYNLSFADVTRAIRGTSANISSGNIRTKLGDMQLRTRQRADSKADFDKIIIRQTADGATIRVGDVANVKDGFAEVNMMATMNGQRTVLVQIKSGPKMNVVKIAKEVKAYLEKKRLDLPQGVTLTLWNDASEAYNSRIRTIGSNFFSGLALVLITLMLFLRPAIALWVSAGIATAFAGGLALLPLMGVSFNMISTFAFLLVIGVIVDDAIIVGEAIHRKTEDGERGLDAVASGTQMVLKPVIFAVLTTMIFFAPWMFLSGTTKEFTRAISLVVILALFFSLVESLLILPSHLSHLKPYNPHSRLARFQAKIANSILWFAHHVYRPTMKFAVRRRYLTAAAFIAAATMTIGLMTTGIVKFTFMPETESDQINIDVTLPRGTPYSRTLEVLTQIQIAEKKLEEEISEGGKKLVENWYTRSRENNVLALVKLVPPETRALSAKETAERLRELIGTVPDAESITVEYLQNNNGPPLQYVLNSTDMDALTKAASELMAQLRSYDGVHNVVNDSQSATDEVQFNLKPGAESLGITITDVARQIRQGFFGDAVQRLPRDGKDVRVYVRYPRSDRESLDFLKNMRIRTNDGREVPLYSVAEMHFAPGISQILRRERQRAIIVSAEVVTDRIGEIQKDMKENFLDKFDADNPKIHRGNIGRAQGQAEFMKELITLSLIAFSIAYILVAIAFRSYAQPLLILFAAIPFCFMGAVLGHLVWGQSMNLFSLLGFMAAAGVAVNDNLVLVDYVNRLRDNGVGAARALVEAGTERFRPIILTSLTTFVGLLPLLMAKSIQAQVLIPVAIGLSYGVLFALFVTLFFVPALYAIGADIRRLFVWLIWGVPQPRFGESLDELKGEDVDHLEVMPAE